MVDKCHYKLISDWTVRLLGCHTINRMSDPQVGSLNMALTRLVNEHHPALKVRDAELEGAYEMIVLHVLPFDSHEHYRLTKESCHHEDFIA
jgi:hypothetical protein